MSFLGGTNSKCYWFHIPWFPSWFEFIRISIWTLKAESWKMRALPTFHSRKYLCQDLRLCLAIEIHVYMHTCCFQNYYELFAGSQQTANIKQIALRLWIAVLCIQYWVDGLNVYASLVAKSNTDGFKFKEIFDMNKNTILQGVHVDC